MKPRRMATLLVVTVLLMMVIISLAPFVAAQPPPEEPGETESAQLAPDPSYRVSDSPWLWLPEDERNWPSMEYSAPAEAVVVEDPTALEFYTVSTGEVIRFPNDGQAATESGPRSVAPFQGLLPPGSGLESVLPPDGRTRVTATASYPWRTICKLQMRFPDGATGGCSGAIVGCANGHGYHVLTAGHCVYSHDHGGWFTSVKIIPGYDNGYMPYNYAWATNAWSYTGWTSSGMTQHDWALIILDRNVGDYTGWMGRMTKKLSQNSGFVV